MDDADRELRKREERRAVEEGGGGVSEGFEQSEELLIEHTSHGDEHATHKIGMDAGVADEEAGAIDDDKYGEADHEHSSEGDGES